MHAPLADATSVFVDPGRLRDARRLTEDGRPQVLRRRRRRNALHLDVRYRVTGEPGAPARDVVDPEKLTRVRHAVLDLAGNVANFRVVPDHYADRLNASGTFRFEADGDGTMWIVDGELSVVVPGNGGAVERAIVSALGEHIAQEAALVEEWLSRQDGRRSADASFATTLAKAERGRRCRPPRPS